MTPTEVTLRIKAGVEAKSYDEVRCERPGPLLCLSIDHSPTTDKRVYTPLSTLHMGRQWQLAKAEKLKPLELTLRKLEDLAESVSVSFNHLKQREADHRDTNGELIVGLASDIFLSRSADIFVICRSTPIFDSGLHN